MTKRALSVLFFAFSSVLFGQLDSNTVTVTASASTNVQPDQVVFGVYVSSGLSTSLDDVLAALKSSGITAANFSGVTTSTQLPPVVGQQPQQPLLWSFGLPVPFTQMKATVTMLTALEQSIGHANSGLTLSFQVSGTEASAALLASQSCNLIQLIANATTQAQQLANAAGLSIGPILAMSSGASTPVASQVLQSGAFISANLVTSHTCAVTVKFSMLKY